MTKPKLEDFPHPQGGYSNLSFHNALIAWQEGEITQLRGNLSLAEDGLAAAMQDIQRLEGVIATREEALRALTRELPPLEFAEHCDCCKRNKITLEVFGPSHEPSEQRIDYASPFDKHPPGTCNRRSTPEDPCDRNCMWPECGCIWNMDGQMNPAQKLSASEAASFDKTLARSPRRMSYIRAS